MAFCCYSLQARYCWPELIKRRLSRSDYNHPRVCLATSLLVALAVIGEFFLCCTALVHPLFKHSDLMNEHIPLEQTYI
jgi:hypothetical protein